ncbi:hypothetical protein PF005_g11535 [Phytophthora fragariae]|uniref:Uncharacterized protein n=2 Tax=Phytophthora fragariae TaxID=53985 RepID=A0A6A3EVT6_9STRA|nr:hypothetical protein PF003_g17601 [Phytophthora fragariae]KAE8936723.1 hypothetical protein PF009_g13350 [Phytophthora fragariae]KAE9001884.1 hypothetical protein PF011_g13553 [Phytophthora fragariae]KAE9092021.1 hypothetical protein PF007_g18673 [Phytophthora fragariae]KAE9107840.1 hypothetical protein PF010_g12129 [Phytophthora fragariae]
MVFNTHASAWACRSAGRRHPQRFRHVALGRRRARNVLLRQKLRKRYDSADETMKKAAARAAPATRAGLIRRRSSSNSRRSFSLSQSDAAKPKRTVLRITPAVLHDPPGVAELDRNVLIQRKLQTKSSFDSADY